MNRPKTLVILSPAFPEKEGAHYWVPSHELFVKALKNNYPELNIIVLAFLYPAQTYPYTWNQVQVVPFNGMGRRKLRKLMLWKNIWRELSIIRRRNEVIGLFSFWCGECALLGKYFGSLYSIRHRCWICGMDAKKENKLVRYIRPKSGELVAMSGFLLQTFYRNHGIKPVSVIPNGIDKNLFGNGNIPKEKDIDILGVGSLERFKQYHVFVRVVAALRNKFPGIRAIHCGDGVERENIQKLIREEGLEKNLILMGEMPHGEILEFMQRTKILLHPSAYEGFSTVCLEALYAGAQVISFCDPMDKRVSQWHIIQTEEQMTEKAAGILGATDTEYKPVLLHSMDEIARSVMELFE